ncbi:hypothetical protein IW245_005303 [Longispora fulva]|uniref:Uncharacterized protein n=1 Tax=Longispora fulva TaxID=619741 RepID=A0A8J7GV61_9ACTN|nr:hypothetical protein [Longispora fulva]
MTSTVRPTGTLIVGLISGVVLGAVLPVLGAAAGVLSWPGGHTGEAHLGWRFGLAGSAVIIAAAFTRFRTGGSDLRVVASAASGGLVAVPLAAAAASWGRLYGGVTGPAEAGVWALGGVLAGALIGLALLTDRLPKLSARDEWRFPGDRTAVEWAELDLQWVRGPESPSPGSAVLADRGRLLSRDGRARRRGRAPGPASRV